MLEKAGLLIKILTDYRNLQYFMSIKQLSYHQKCWSEFLLRFNFVIQYWPSKLEAKTNAFTRKLGDFLKKEDGCLQKMV